MRRFWLRSAALAAALGVAAPAAAASHHPIFMPNVQNVGKPALQPPPVCCTPVAPPPAGAPAPVNTG